MENNYKLYRPRVKICGITQPQDALAAAEYGADAIGFVFYPPSPRAVTVEKARLILQQMPPFITTVGLFVNAEPTEVKNILSVIPLDLLQFHGEEPPDYCQQFYRPYIKALRMKPDIDVLAEINHYSSAQAILLDTYIPGEQGGTGKRFDWQRVPSNCNKPLILAGGLTAENVSQAIQTLSPYALDVSGGVESSKGIKNVSKMAAFMQQVKMSMEFS